MTAAVIPTSPTTATGVPGVPARRVRAVRAETATVEPSIDDIDQGDLGDCWFLAGLGAVAGDNPELIEDHIEDNGDGTYTVTFYEEDDGRWVPVEVTVDGDFPVDADGNAAYAKPSGDETWVMIYEKAFAELHGGYGDIEGGSGEHSMEQITAGSSTTSTSTTCPTTSSPTSSTSSPSRPAR